METSPLTQCRGFFSLRRSQMTPAEAAQLDAALADPETFQSTEKDGVLPWLILGLVAAVVGLVAGLAETNWAAFGAAVRAGRWEGLTDHAEGLGTMAALGVTVGIVWFFLRVHKRWGFVLLPNALGVIRGPKVTLIRVEDVATASSRTVSQERRSFSVLEVTGLDGSRRTFYGAGILHRPLRDKLEKLDKPTVR